MIFHQRYLNISKYVTVRVYINPLNPLTPTVTLSGDNLSKNNYRFRETSIYNHTNPAALLFATVRVHATSRLLQGVILRMA